MLHLLFFFNDTATTEIYTLSLHDALPILSDEFLASLSSRHRLVLLSNTNVKHFEMIRATYPLLRSEEHTSELQSQSNLVCRLLLEKKKKNYPRPSRQCQDDDPDQI